MTQKIIFSLAVIVCLISVKWAYSSHWDYEPVIAIIASIAQVLGLWKGEEIEAKIRNKDIEDSLIDIEAPSDAEGGISTEKVKKSFIKIKQTK